jgi:hypothetical protein
MARRSTAGTDRLKVEVGAAEVAYRLEEAKRLVEAIHLRIAGIASIDPSTAEINNDWLACMIAEHLLGWRDAEIPVDARGENACQVLTQTGSLPEGWVPNPIGRYARGVFLPTVFGDQRRRLLWFSGIPEALKLARTLLRVPQGGLMWSRDFGGRFTLAARNPLEPWSCQSGPHCATDALAVIDAALTGVLARAEATIEATET